MQVQILVILDITKAGTEKLPPRREVLASALQAVRNTLENGEGNGFEHDLACQTFIHIQSVQPFSADTVKSRWRCSKCQHEVSLTFSQLAESGNPICGEPGCKNEGDEMDLITG